MTPPAMPPDDVPLLQRLVTASIEACEQGVPHEVERAAGSALLDFLSCAVSGLGEGTRATGVLAPGPSPSLLGAPGASEQVAALHAAASHAGDRDDVHWPSFTHPGSIVWAAALAAAPPDSTAIPVMAVAVGYEVVARLAMTLGPGHRRHWHVTTTAGTVGASVTSALAGGLGPDVAASAAAHAASVSGGTIQTLLERSESRLFSRAHAARTGMLAAAAAARGLASPQHVLEATAGWLAATAPDVDPTVMPAPGPLALTQITRRLYGTNGWAHTAVEAALHLQPLPPEAITAVEVRVPSTAVRLAGSSTRGNEAGAWWSIPYAVAVTLVSNSWKGLEDRALRDDPRVERIADLVVVSDTGAEPGDLAAEIIVALGTGDERRALAEVARGHPDRPLSRHDLIEKWRVVCDRTDDVALAELASAVEDLSSVTPGELLALAMVAAGRSPELRRR